MGHCKKAKYIYIPIRNTVIVLLCLVVGLFVAERHLAERKNGKTLYDKEFRQEDYSVRYMIFSKTPRGNIEASAAVSKWASIFQLDEFISNVPPAGYPLIDVYGTEQPEEDAFNIVVIGDSFVWGDGCTNRNELFWRQLEQLLRKKGYSCRVYGVGMGGANAYEELSWLKDSDLAAELAPDIVIFGYVGNDAHPTTDVVISGSIKEYQFWFTPFNKLFPNLYSNLTERLSIETLYNQKYGDLIYGSDIAVLRGEIYNYYKNHFVNELNDYAARVDFPIVVMTLPSEPYYFFYHKLFEPLYELYGKADNLHFYDCLKSFCKFDGKEHTSNYAISPINTHPGTASNYFFANYIVSFLENDFSLSERCRRIESKDESVYINDTMPGNLNVTKISAVDNKAVYQFTYPSENTIHKTEYYEFKDFLYQPIKEDYVKLCFSSPVDIDSISLTCADATNLKLYYTEVNEALGYDDHSVMPIEKDSEGAFVVGSGGLRSVTAICVHADIRGGETSDIVMTIQGRQGE